MESDDSKYYLKFNIINCHTFWTGILFQAFVINLPNAPETLFVVHFKYPTSQHPRLDATAYSNTTDLNNLLNRTRPPIKLEFTIDMSSCSDLRVKSAREI